MRVYTLQVYAIFLFLVFSYPSRAQQQNAHKATDSAGRITISTYDSNGQLVSTTDGAGHTKHLAGVAVSAPAATAKVSSQSAQPAAPAVIIHVPADQPTIQAAINAASNGDTVLVSDGTYVENINFKGKATTVTSVNGPKVTTIDGGAVDSVVTFNTSETSTSVLNGFTIRNGAVGPSSTFSGSGIFIGSSSPTIINNIITANAGCQGSGIDVQFGSPLIQGNTISQNSQRGCSGGTGGGGILLGGAAQAQILNNTISQNSTGVDGGGISLFAAGNPVIRGNIISGNSANGQGGGISMGNQSDAVVTDNLIISNSASQGGGVGTLVPAQANGPVFTNNTLAGNTAPQGGAQIYFSGFANQTQFFNNIFFGVSSQTAVDCDTTFSPQAPIFKFNDAFNLQGTTYVGSCAGETGTNSNISADPLLVDIAVNNYHLQPTSPAVDAGTNATPAPLPPTDLDGNPRIFHNTVDIGAFEYQGPTTTTFSSTSLVFSAQLVGTASATQGVTITNTGSTALQITPFILTGDFSENDTCHTSNGIAAGQSCTINISFVPTGRGTRTGQLTVISNDAASPTNINLAGTGIAPVVKLSVSSLNFTNQTVNTTSSAQQFMLSNTGDAPLTVASIATSGDFAQTNNCGTSVAIGASCTVNVTFTPTLNGTRTGAVTITDNAAGSPQIVSLTGIGGFAPIVVLSGTKVAFGDQIIGGSRVQMVSLSNTGTAALTISSMAITGTNGGDFSQTNTCGGSVAIGAHCFISVTFTPTASGSRTGSLQIIDDARNSPQTISLTGAGTGPAGDFDGDGKADYAVWRPSSGTWFVIPSKTPSNFLVQQWGVSTDIVVRGDYDGDGKTDFAVWRPSSGTWFVIPSSNPSVPMVQQWGTSGDILVPGDYDGDGKTDFAVWRPSSGTWFVIPSSNPGVPMVQQWGTSGDKPVPGDYDGDGKTDFAVWRPSSGTWFVIPSSNPSVPMVQQWGVSTDIPTPQDYDGDRKTDFAVWRPSEGTWYVIPSSAPTNYAVTQWGISTDVPVQKPVGQ